MSNMRLMSCVAGAALLFGTAALAQMRNDRGAAGPKGVVEQGASPAALGGSKLTSPYAQAAASVLAGGTIVSSKGFSAVSHPAVGQYCLELAGGILTASTPMVSIDWSTSSGNILFAYVRSSNSGCPSATARTINIVTYATSSGTASDAVSFMVVVP